MTLQGVPRPRYELPAQPLDAPSASAPVARIVERVHQ